MGVCGCVWVCVGVCGCVSMCVSAYVCALLRNLMADIQTRNHSMYACVRVCLCVCVGVCVHVVVCGYLWIGIEWFNWEWLGQRATMRCLLLVKLHIEL